LSEEDWIKRVPDRRIMTVDCRDIHPEVFHLITQRHWAEAGAAFSQPPVMKDPSKRAKEVCLLVRLQPDCDWYVTLHHFQTGEVNCHWYFDPHDVKKRRNTPIYALSVEMCKGNPDGCQYGVMASQVEHLRRSGISPKTYVARFESLNLAMRSRRLLAFMHAIIPNPERYQATELANNVGRMRVHPDYLRSLHASPEPAETPADASFREAVKQARAARPKQKKIVVPSGYVYGIQHPNNPGWIKLGASVEPTKRLSEAQIWDPLARFTLAFRVMTTRECAVVERELHGELTMRQGVGEWFSGTVIEASEIAKRLAATPTHS
jgi:hypothetical protein